MRVPSWAVSVAIAAALVGLVAWSAWQRWLVLADSPFPLGVDGYYYALQLRGLVESSALELPASPLTFWFMAPFAAATDPITGAKLGAAIGTALIALPAYAVGAQLGKSRGAGLVAAAIATTSASSAYLSIEFVKQGFGLTVGLTALWLVLRALATPSRRKIGAAIVAIVATVLAHKLAAAIVVGIAVPATLVELRKRSVLRGRRLLYVYAAAGVLALVALVLALVAPDRFVSVADLALVGDLFTADARWDAPALATRNLTLAFDHEALLGLVAGVLAVAFVIRKRGTPIAARILVIAAIAIGLPWLAVSDPQGLGFRVRVTAFVPLALTAALLAPLAVRWLDERWRTPVLAVVALAIVLRPQPPRLEGRVLAHPALVTAVMASAKHIPADATVIVPERHIMFMVAYYTRADVALRPERVPYARRLRLMPLAFIGVDSPLDRALDDARREPSLAPPIGLHPRHPNGVVLVTEPTWDWLMTRVPPRAAAYWRAWPTI